MGWKPTAVMAGCLFASQIAQANGFWLSAQDLGLRQDLTLLSDEGVVRLPVMTWPLPVADVRRAMSRVALDDIHEPGLLAAAQRVLRATEGEGPESFGLRELRISAGEQAVLRDYATLARENGEFSVRSSASGERWSVGLRVTAALSPQDDRSMRLDGSDASLRLGNWIFSASQLERWWGPGYDGSLILSTNARPMPHFAVDRAESVPFATPLLRWLGPWSASLMVGTLERRRPDVDHPLFMGMRVSFQPLPILQLAVSRSAQFCGQNDLGTRPSCDLGQVGRVLIGRDNEGFLGTDRTNEPGNQMAGFDMRLTSPIRRFPVAIYAQMIGEDSSNRGSSPVPNRYLGLMGLDTWNYLESGGVLRARVEYANTNCKWYAPTTGFGNCAYRQSIFQAGYRYRTRNIGHTTDADAESIGVTLSMQLPDGEQWGVRIRRALLDRYNGVDPFNPLTQGPGEYRAAEVSWRGTAIGQDLSVQLGFETHEPGLRPRESGAFGFLQWRKPL